MMTGTVARPRPEKVIMRSLSLDHQKTTVKHPETLRDGEVVTPLQSTERPTVSHLSTTSERDGASPAALH